MNRISKVDFARLTAEEQARVTPVLLTADNVPYAVVGKIDEIIILSDLHPRIRRNFKAMEEKVRVGMPGSKRIYADEAKKPPKTEQDKLVEKVYGS